MTASTPPSPAGADPRAEHDALARRLEVRASIDALKRGFTTLFLGLISVGLTVKLAWDRWGELKPGVVRIVRGPPVFLWIATAAAVVLLAVAVRALSRARRLAQEEDRLYARFRELRAVLRLDG
jgi:hypothetical protein